MCGQQHKKLGSEIICLVKKGNVSSESVGPPHYP